MRDRVDFGGAVGWLVVAVVLSVGKVSDGATLRGTVVDRDGKPAAGAKVWVAKLGFLEALESRETTADDSGAYAVEIADGDWLAFALRGDEGGHLDFWSMIHAAGGKDPAAVEIRLGPPTRLRGRLIDEGTGEPVRGGRFALDDGRRFEVDERGRFEVPGLEMTHHEAYPLCPGYERRRILFDTTGRPDSELELALTRGGKVVGRVVDLQGRPLKGASVGFRTSGSILSGSALWERCDDDGRFAYEGKAVGRDARLSARAPGYEDREREDVFVVDAEHPAEVEFRLRPDPRKPAGPAPREVPADRRTVAGLVTGLGGKPLEGVTVRWGLVVSSDDVPETKTDASGAFQLAGVPDRPDVLTVIARGYAPKFPPVEAGGDRVADVELERGATIKGQVVDGEGGPVPGARVVAKVPNPRANQAGTVYLYGLEVTTGADGAFTLEGMPKGVTCDVVAGGRSAVRNQPLSAEDPAKNQFTLLKGGAVRGRVVDASGRPVRNFRVRVEIPRVVMPGDAPGGYFAGYAGVGLSFTRDDGEFTVTGLTAPGVLRLVVDGGPLGRGEADRVEAVPEDRLKPAADLTVRLDPPHALRVRATGPGGRPVAGARVTVTEVGEGGQMPWGLNESNWEESVTARAGEDGWADLRALPFGRGNVVVRAGGFGRKRVAWSGNEAALEVDLEPEARIRGTLLDTAGKPVAPSRIVLVRDGESTPVAVDPGDGRFEAGGLPAGKYQLVVVFGVAAGRHAEPVELESGETFARDVRVDPPAPR